MKAKGDHVAAIDVQIADVDAAAQGGRETEARTVDAAATKADREARQQAMKDIDEALADRAKAGKMIDAAIADIGKAMAMWNAADDRIDRTARPYPGGHYSPHGRTKRVWGQDVYVRVGTGWSRIIKKNKKQKL